MTTLEAKNVQLEAKVEEQEKNLNFLLQATELPVSGGDSKLFLNNRQIQSNLGKISGIPRTCRELRASNPSFASGMQWIDPDGQGIGDDPIYVYCDMSTGWKLIQFLLLTKKFSIHFCYKDPLQLFTTVSLPLTWAIALILDAIPGQLTTTRPSNKSKPWPNCLLNVINRLK